VLDSRSQGVSSLIGRFFQQSSVGTSVAVFGIRYWFASPVHSFSLSDSPHSFGLLAFFLLSAAVVAMGEIHRRGREALRKALQVNLCLICEPDRCIYI
jgi:hypothetical protein